MGSSQSGERCAYICVMIFSLATEVIAVLLSCSPIFQLFSDLSGTAWRIRWVVAVSLVFGLTLFASTWAKQWRTIAVANEVESL